jgi:hypothetical protein
MTARGILNFDDEKDLAGNPRRFGTAIDLGPYECGAIYGITLSQTSEHVFTAATYGYAAQTPLTVTVTNTGNVSTGALTVALSGTHASSFAISSNTIPAVGIAASGTATFNVAPNTGLAVGTYTATVTVSGDANITEQSFTVSFTVNKANPIVNWPTGLTATYGETLGDISLPGNGTSTPAGTFTWTAGNTTPVGTAGTQTHNMTDRKSVV